MFGKKKKINDAESKKEVEKNKMLSGENIRIKIYELLNSIPVHKYEFLATRIKDRNENVILFNEENNFKNEFPGIKDALISNIQYRLETRSSNKETQINILKKAIENQNNRIKNIQNGKLKIIRDGVETVVHVNEITEEYRLKGLKIAEYDLKNLGGTGSYEMIEHDGMRCLSYIIMNGDIVPIKFNNPLNGEPLTLLPDVANRKKQYKDNSDELIFDAQDFFNTPVGNVLRIITYVLVVLLFLGNAFWSFQNMKWAQGNADADISSEVNDLRLQGESIRQECGKQIATQVDNNEVLINVGKKYLQNSLNNPSGNVEEDKNNIKI